ncbi:hypothetical protein BDN67DRAFT_1015812 [Paxillus ammoniavirescens]|nr:hypothetical protein BDN67DRAFT_1015812 [Paxillus ammoniavirescens]
MFKDRMRDLIVSPQLSNGKPSTCPLKKVLVHFEDASAEDQAIGSSNSKAGASSRTAAQGKQKAPVQASGQLEGGDRLKELIAKLQEHWKSMQMPQTMPPGFPTPAGPYSYPPPSVIVLPPWGMPPGYQGTGQMFPSSPYDPSSTHLTRSPSPMPSSLHTRSPSPLPGPSTSTQAAEIPDIIS